MKTRAHRGWGTPEALITTTGYPRTAQAGYTLPYMTTTRLSENGENVHPPTVAKTVMPAAAILRTTLLPRMKTTTGWCETEREDAPAIIPPLPSRTLPTRRM